MCAKAFCSHRSCTRKLKTPIKSYASPLLCSALYVAISVARERGPQVARSGKGPEVGAAGSASWRSRDKERLGTCILCL